MGVEQIVNDLDSAGLQKCKIAFKGDQENAIGGMQNQVMRKRAEHGHNTAITNSPVGDSDNNGRVEKAIQEVVGVARTLRSALEERIKQEIPITHPLMPWLISQAANVLNRYQIRQNRVQDCNGERLNHTDCGVWRSSALQAAQGQPIADAGKIRRQVHARHLGWSEHEGRHAHSWDAEWLLPGR